MSLDRLTIGVHCTECDKHWKANLTLSGNTIEAFAAVCECGNILVGNYNYEFHKSINFSNELTLSLKKRLFLSNGHFEIFSLKLDEINKYEELILE